jgi:geranylgeranyl pyrophosphate synthase
LPEAAPANRTPKAVSSSPEDAAHREAFPALLKSWQARMETALASRLPAGDEKPARLHAAMRYSALGGGKRIRPALVFATARTLAIPEAQVEAIACAIEFVHVYSLIHDDLPAMDDDDLRRGRPTCHKAFDEATAILAGDALQSLAFQVLAADVSLTVTAETRLRLIGLLGEASGTFGMAGGQAIDLAAQGKRLDITQVEDMHARKTGALMRASVLMAATCLPNLGARYYDALAGFVAPIGLAFQIQDDLLDVLGETAVLGKAAGADSERDKPTHPAILGVEASQERVHRLHAEALGSLEPFGAAAAPLRALAAWLLARGY